MQPHVQDLQHIGGPQRIPGIEDIVVAKADVNLRFQHFFHPRDAAPFRVAVEAPLQVNIDQRVSDKVDAGHFQQAEQPRSVSAVIGVHRGGMAGGHLGAHIQLQRQRRHGFDKARLLIVNLIAMYVHQPIVFLRQRKGFVQRLYAVFARELEVRNGPHHVSPQPQRLFQQCLAVGIGHNAFLRESDDLQRHPGRDLLLHLQHGAQRGQGRI
ncbi:hypothetical protein D3C79_415180 [compost metagenome]